MPSLAQLASVFFRAGNTTLGGGDPTMAVLQREFERRKWIGHDQFALVFGLARVTPFTNLLAFCAGTAWIMAGLIAGIIAVLVVTIPSAALVIWLTHVCEIGATNRWAASAIGGCVAAAAGTTIASAYRIVQPQIRKSNWIWTAAIVITSFLLSRVFALSPIPILAIAAVAGLFRNHT